MTLVASDGADFVGVVMASAISKNISCLDSEVGSGNDESKRIETPVIRWIESCGLCNVFLVFLKIGVWVFLFDVYLLFFNFVSRCLFLMD